MQNDKTLRMVIGALLGVGCGAFLLIACVASGVWMASRAPIASGPSYPPPDYPPPSYPPPVLPPPVLPPPVLPPPPVVPGGDVAPRIVRATVTEITGAAGIAVGALCEFNVERRDNDTGGFWCNAQIVCGGRLFYGGSGAGYFPCTLYEGPPRDVVGEDTGTTTGDGDAAMRLDTRAGTLEVWDDTAGTNGEFRVTAHVDVVE